MSGSRFPMANVVEGEASESDDDECPVKTTEEDPGAAGLTPPRPLTADDGTTSADQQTDPSSHRLPTADDQPTGSRQSRPGQTGGTLVSGEASESDDDYQPNPIHLDIPLKIEDEPGLANVSPVKKSLVSQTSTTSRHEDLLIRKLKETNERLKSHTENFRVKRIENAVKDLKVVLMQLCKSQTVLKDASVNLRAASNDLFHLEDKLDIVASCTLIPYINIAPLPSQKTLRRPSNASPVITGTI